MSRSLQPLWRAQKRLISAIQAMTEQVEPSLAWSGSCNARGWAAFGAPVDERCWVPAAQTVWRRQVLLIAYVSIDLTGGGISSAIAAAAPA